MGSHAFVTKLLMDARASYWFLPSLLVCLAVLVAQVFLAADRTPGLAEAILPQGLRDTQVTGARGLMAIISQSVFGVAGVMFSMTIVAVSFASGNFGPRLIGNFMRDRGNQWSLGILVSTFVYALVITRAIQEGTATSADFVPHLSIALALVLTFLCIFTVIFFVHHIPETINVSNIAARLGEQLVRDIKDLIDSHCDLPDEPIDIRDSAPTALLTLERSGYVQTLDMDRLRQIAGEQGLLIDVGLPVGAFVTEDTCLARIWGSRCDDTLMAALRDCFALGHSPTEAQNLLFVVDQLVEMIARAMSPGVNDPFTAVTCLNWLHAATGAAANHRGGLRPLTQGGVRLPQVGFDDLLAAGFGAAQPYVAGDPICDRHFRLVLSALAGQIAAPAHRETFRRFTDRLEV